MVGEWQNRLRRRRAAVPQVNPGAKERLVQITGPSEGKITYAKQLMEETIKRNASPVRSEMLEKEHHESNSSLNSSGSDDSSRYGCLVGGPRRGGLAHSFSTSDATIGEYKYTVTIGDDTLKITGTNPNLVTVAKLVLDEYFLTESYDQLVNADYEEEANYFDRVNDENAEETAGVQQPPPSFATTKTIPSKELLNPNEIEAAMCPDIEKPNAKQGIPTEITSKPLKKYSMEEILFLAESPLSRRFPEDWLRLSNEFGSIVKKPPIDWFDPKSYLKERPREGEAVSPAEAIPDMETLDRD